MLARRTCLLLGGALALGGCGFRLRGQGVVYAFRTVRIEATAATPLVNELVAQLRASGLLVTGSVVPTLAGTPATPTPPEIVLQLLQDQRERVVVGSTASGQVRELQLRQRLRFRLQTAAGRELLAPTEMLHERDLSFSETQVLGKEMEEALLFQDMQTAAVRQLLYRLAAIKPF